MKVRIKKWGNSAAIRLPAAFLAAIGAKIGDTIEITPGAVRCTKPAYKLADLLAQCDKNALPPADMTAWDAAPPVGRREGLERL